MEKMVSHVDHAYIQATSFNSIYTRNSKPSPINKRRAFLKTNQKSKYTKESHRHESLCHKAFHSANIICVTNLYYL